MTMNFYCRYLTQDMATKKAEEQPADHAIQSDELNSYNNLEDRGTQGGYFVNSQLHKPKFYIQRTSLDDQLNTLKTEIKTQGDTVLETIKSESKTIQTAFRERKIQEETEEERLNAYQNKPASEETSTAKFL